MYTPINIFSKISKGDEISLFAQPVIIHSSFHLAWSLQLQIKLFSLTNPEKYCYQTTEYVKYGLYYDKISSKINAAYLSIFISTLLNLYFLCKF